MKIKKYIVGAVVGAAVVWVRLYGEYKYACGRVDANELNKIVIDSQHDTIKTLLEKLKNQQEEAH